ncbi:MAG: sodium:solute symporter family protein [Stackebrandtia sp.]
MQDWMWGVLVLVVYLGLVLYIGYRSFGASDHTLEDHMVGGRNFGVFVLTLTYAATFHSAYAFTGIVGFAYNDGVGFWINSLYLIPPAFLFWQVGKRLWLLGKRYNFMTLGDYLSHAYDSRAIGLITALVHTFFTAPYVAIQLTGSGYIFETMTNGRVSFAAGAAVMLVVMVVYVIAGGLRAVAWTDTLQGVMMYVVIFAGGLYVVREEQGSFTNAFERLNEQLPEWFTLPGPAGTITPTYWLTLWIPFTLGLLLLPQIVTRIFAARSLRVLKWSSLGGAVYLVTIYMFVPGVAAVGLLQPGAAEPDQIFVDLLWSNLPVVLGAIALSGGFAAAMSTADSQIHAVSATLAVDGYQKYIDKSRDPVRTKRFTYATHLALGVAAYIFVITDDKLLIDLLAITLTGIALLAPATFGALYWKRGTAAGAITSTLAGLAVLFATTAVWWEKPLWENPFDLGVTPGMWSLVAGTLIYIAVSLFTRPTEAMVESQRFTTEYLHRAVADKPEETAPSRAAARR